MLDKQVTDLYNVLQSFAKNKFHSAEIMLCDVDGKIVTVDVHFGRRVVALQWSTTTFLRC